MSKMNLAQASSKTLKNPKLLLLEQEIDSTRVKKDSTEIHDLVSKYHKKYFTETTAYGMFALWESSFKEPDIAYDTGVVLPSNFDGREYLQSLQKIMEMKDQDHQYHSITMSYCRLWMAYLHFLSREFKNALGDLEKVDFNLLKDKQDTAYGVSMVLMYHSLKGWVHYHLSDLESCLTEHELGYSVVKTVDSSITAYLPLKRMEFCIFGYILHLQESENIDSSLTICNTYLETEKYHLLGSSLCKISILRGYIKGLLVVMNEKHPLEGIFEFSSVIGGVKVSPEKQELLSKIRHVLPTYESLVTDLCNYPFGDEQRPEWVTRVRNVEDCYRWWTQIEMHKGRLQDDGIGDVLDRYYGTLEILYRGTTHTFNSLLILRSICHTFFSIVSISKDSLCLDEKLEAKLAVDSYVFHWEKKFTLALDAKMRAKRDQQPPNRDSLKPYLSHRLSGQISQFPDFSAMNFEPNLNTIVDEEEEFESRPSTFIAKNAVIVEEVDRESVEDVVGVLITGMRLILCMHEGDVEMLKEAAAFGEKAFVILTEHGFRKPDYFTLLSTTFQWLGITYGELALEVVEKEERSMYQNQTIIMLSKAVQLERKNSILHYQLAIAYADSGKFELSIDSVNQALTLDPFNPSFYNLLCLLLTAQGHYAKAKQIAAAGWNACLEKLATIKASNIEPDRRVSWEVVDPSLKEELLNLKMTHLAVEMKLYGPEKMIDSLQKTFILFRRLIGSVAVEDIKKEEDMKISRRSSNTPTMAGRMNHFIIPKSPSSTFVPVVHRFRTFEIQITLWVTVASVYRELKQTEKASQALDEAEKLLITFSTTHHRVRHQSSRVFRDASLSDSSSNIRKDNRAKTNAGGYWRDSDPAILRIQADIALEKAMILYEVFKLQNVSSPPERYSQYTSPATRAEQERMSKMRKHQRSNSAFGGSCDSISICHTVLTDAASFSGSVSAFEGFADANASRTSINDRHYDIDVQKKEITLSQVIHAAQLALLFDNNHLSSRTFLGMMYFEKGDMAQAEHHLSLSCSFSRHRGSSSGRSGITSCFGGSTSFWGWYGWYLLSQIFAKQERLIDAQRAGVYSLNLEKISCIRGYECLVRFQ